MYILKDSLLFDDINCSHPFFLCCCHYLTEALEAIHYVRSNVFISHHLVESSMITSGLWLILGHLKGTMFIWGKHCGPALLGGAYLFYRTSCSSFCSKFTVLIKCMKTLAVILFLHGECVNVANSHLQLQLFINYSKDFRREIVDICSCKGDYWNSWLSPKNCSFGVLNLALTFFDNDVDYNDELFLWCVRPTKDV